MQAFIEVIKNILGSCMGIVCRTKYAGKYVHFDYGSPAKPGKQAFMPILKVPLAASQHR